MKFVKSHKIWSTVIILAVLAAGYYGYKHITAANAATQYVLSRARTGSITETVTGSGQVSASNQLDIKSQVSGAVTSIKVSVGQHVAAGETLATIDSSQAVINLENARLSLAKLTQPPKATDVTNAQNSVTKSYADAFNAVSTTFLDLPADMAGMKDMLYGQNTFLSDAQSINLNQQAHDLRQQTGVSFDKSANEYLTVFNEYRNLTRASATSGIDGLLSDTIQLARDVSTALQNGQNTVTYIRSNLPSYDTGAAASAETNITTWSTTINSDASSLLSARNSIATNQNILSNLLAGSDALDIQSQRLSLQQQEQTYANYFIRAPFAGTVGRIPVNVYDQASSGSVISTLVGDQKISIISLNEVDAAKIHVGQPVMITFDAIDGLNATGTVSEVDLVGTVTQGVVTYNVKIAINTSDDRIRPGMSVNATIITSKLDNVLVVPSSAVKTQGNASYVQVFDNLPVATSTLSTTVRRMNSTIPSATPPRNQIVTVGQSDDSNTQIVSGLSGREWVVTRTISSSNQTTASAPSILNTLGGNRAGTGGGNATFRAVGR